MDKAAKQIKLSKSLQILDFVIAVFVIAFFGGLIIVKYNHDGLLAPDFDTLLDTSLVVASAVSIVVCMAILFFFLGVCHEIGKDNSFSLENTASLHKMAICGGVYSAIYVVRELVQIITGNHGAYTLGYNVIMIFLGIIFLGICECLSRLVKNAYEIKLENELTI